MSDSPPLPPPKLGEPVPYMEGPLDGDEVPFKGHSTIRVPVDQAAMRNQADGWPGIDPMHAGWHMYQLAVIQVARAAGDVVLWAYHYEGRFPRPGEA